MKTLKPYLALASATVALFLAAHALLMPKAGEAQLAIDIVSSPRKLPIAVLDLDGIYGSAISDIIREDLAGTGLFDIAPTGALPERPEQPFNASRWSGTGLEAVVKGTVDPSTELKVTVRLYDVVENSLALEKLYTASRTLVRPLGHTIANEVYERITGKKGLFRSKLIYMTRGLDSRLSLVMTDWDGRRAIRTPLEARAAAALRWAPDARSAIYSAEREGKWAIYSINLTTLESRELVSGLGTAIASEYFPDGKGFLLSSAKAGSPDLYHFSLEGGKLTRMTSELGIEVSASVRQDGESIAYVSDRGGSPQIYTMDKFGYNRQRVTYEGNYNTSPVWSPDGRVIAYSGRVEGINQVFTVLPDGSGKTMLTSQGNNEEPSFSPDGRFLTFTSDRDGMRAVYVMRADGSEQKRLSEPGLEAFGSRWSPN